MALKFWPVMPPTFFFPKIGLAVCVFLWFQRSCRIVCSVAVKIAIGILIGIALNLKIALVFMNILTVLILQSTSPEYLSIYLCLAVFFINVVQFSVYIIFDLLVKFIPRWFILFHVILFFKYS